MNRRLPQTVFVGALALACAALAWAADATEPPKEATPAGTPAPAAQKSTVPLPLTPRFVQVRARIDALFAHRKAPPPTPNPRLNPFRPPGAIIAPESSEPAPNATTQGESNDLALLQEAVATMRVSGSFEVSGKSHPVINGRPYKEGDVITTLVRGEAVYVRVRSIAGRTVKLALNEAEVALSFDSRPPLNAGKEMKKSGGPTRP